MTGENPPPVHDFQNYQQYLRKRAGVQAPVSTDSPTITTQTPSKSPSHCDGIDDIGCFQVRHLSNNYCYGTGFTLCNCQLFIKFLLLKNMILITNSKNNVTLFQASLIKFTFSQIVSSKSILLSSSYLCLGLQSSLIA